MRSGQDQSDKQDQRNNCICTRHTPPLRHQTIRKRPHIHWQCLSYCLTLLQGGRRVYLPPRVGKALSSNTSMGLALRASLRSPWSPRPPRLPRPRPPRLPRSPRSARSPRSPRSLWPPRPPRLLPLVGRIEIGAPVNWSSETVPFFLLPVNGTVGTGAAFDEVAVAAGFLALADFTAVTCLKLPSLLTARRLTDSLTLLASRSFKKSS